MICIAHTWFLGIGGYVPALLFIHLGITPWLGMLVGMLCAALLAIFMFYLPFRLGLPSLSFVIYTLALVFIGYHIALGSTLLGRDWGLHLFFQADNPANFQWRSKLPYYYILLVMTVGVGAINWLILRSKVGLFFRGIKDNERVAAAAGVDVVRYKLLAIAISAGLMAPAGTLWGMYSRFVDPETLLAVHLPIKICLYTVIGGVGTFWGPIAGAATLAPLTELIRGAMGARYAGGDMTGGDDGGLDDEEIDLARADDLGGAVGEDRGGRDGHPAALVSEFSHAAFDELILEGLAVGLLEDSDSFLGGRGGDSLEHVDGPELSDDAAAAPVRVSPTPGSASRMWPSTDRTWADSSIQSLAATVAQVWPHATSTW